MDQPYPALAYLFVINNIIKPKIIVAGLCLLFSICSNAQLDSLANKIIDSLAAKLNDDAIPKKTLWDKFMYPHRWYVKQLLIARVPYYDTNFIASNKRKLNLAVAVAKKYYGFNVNDIEMKQTMKFLPNNYYHVGFNCSNIILSFGFYPGIRFGAKPGKGNTSAKDIQLTIIGRRVITDINYQRYKGFYTFIAREQELNRLDATDVKVRPDINVFSFGAGTNFVFNFKKYSLRGAFSFTDIQRRSAGSFMAGLYHSYVLFTSFDTTLILNLQSDRFSPLLHAINNISLITVGLSGGYGYTHVYGKFILSSAINVGGGAQKTNYESIDGHGHTLSFNPSLYLNVKSALRYDNNNFFTGIMATYVNNYTLNARLFNTENYMGKMVLFVGYRFNLKQNGRKVLRTMGLTDYKKT